MCVRVRNAFLDVTILHVHLTPVDSHGKAARIAHQRYAWVHSVLQRLPSRIVPIYCTYANGKLGVRKMGATLQRVDHPSVGPCLHQVHNENSDLLLSFMLRLNMVVSNYFRSCADSFVSGTTGSESTIDCIGTSYAPRVAKAVSTAVVR